METLNTPKNDLEVTGVSRSGRVRKKSSKLMDFQSPNDIETRHKKAALAKQKQTNLASTESPTFSQNSQQNLTQIGNQGGDNVNYSFVPDAVKSEDDQLSSAEDLLAGDNDESFDSDIDLDEAIDDEIVDDDIDDDGLDPTVRRSIYMTEKVNKKKVLKDGKIVYSKAQRKDKGKSRFTAYMLWTKDVRKQMVAQQPDLDFATISRRLGEMWANVPTSEKYIWKRRAKRLANKVTKPVPPKAKESLVTTPSKFLNKGANSNKARKTSQSESNQQLQQQQTNVECKTINLAAQNHLASKTSPVTTPGIYKVTGIEPLDVAAHLKLLGDSLTIIGERLKEHEGQITVSGSLSVLMDSLLCSLGPLMCLTSQIGGVTENNSRLRESLRNTLDNIAYVMPGL